MGKSGAQPRGPAPKPTKMKILHGTDRADRRAKNEMDPKVAELLPKPPVYFDECAKKIWAKATRTLKDLDMLVEVDYELLQSYCYQLSLVERCATELQKPSEGLLIEFTNKAGATNYVANPYIKIYNDALKVSQSLAGQFGFTPSARSRISAPTKGEGDGFDNF